MKRDHIIETIIDSELIAHGSAVVVGVSGGPDSLCLLHALVSLSDMLDLMIVPVHVNHKLRPEADAEADHIADICERMDLDIELFEASCGDIAEGSGVSVEEAGRIIRYEIFDDVARSIEESGVPSERILIALAHNADDQAETVLFRLLRGTGPHGLAGIPSMRLSEAGYFIVRPLLTVDRKDIEGYISENRLRPNIDPSNKDSSYARNRIRNELIPYLEKNYNPKIKEHLRRYAELAYTDDMLLREIALNEYSDSISFDDERDRAVLDLTNVKDNPPSVNSRIVRIILEVLGLESSATYEIVNSIMDLMYSDHPSAGVDLPLGIRAYREYGTLVFSGEDETVRPDESIEIRPQIVMSRDFVPDEDEPYAAFDFDKFNAEHPGSIGEIVLRTRREGDYLPMKNGSKKIQDLLVDSKVSRNARDSVLMAAIGSEVLWILPDPHFSGDREKEKGRFSQKYQICDTTERVLLIELGESM